MTGAGNLPGPSNPLANLARILFAVGALAVGLFVFAVSATFLLFLVAGLAIVGVIVAGFFWARARLTGRPFGPREHFEAHYRTMVAEMNLEPGPRPQAQTAEDGPVIDAHPTPDGWRIDR